MAACTGLCPEPTDHVQRRQRGMGEAQYCLNVCFQQQILCPAWRVGGKDVPQIGIALVALKGVDAVTLYLEADRIDVVDAVSGPGSADDILQLGPHVLSERWETDIGAPRSKQRV